MKYLLINGPNLNLLGVREPEIYGNTTLAQISEELVEYFKEANSELLCFQANSEGQIIEFLHQNADAKGIIINPAALGHYSLSLYDALISIQVPYVEVHISNIYAREEYRHKSVISSKAKGIIIGCSTKGYKLAARYLLDQL